MRTRTTRTQLDLDDLMRQLMLVGFGMLLAWSLTGVVGLISGSFTIAPGAALRFLLAILVVVFARRTYWEIREWHWRRTTPDDRSGFASPAYRCGSNRVSNSSTSIREMAGFATREAST